MCPTSAWLSSTSIICVVPPGTGSGLSARVQLMQCPPGAEPQTTSPESCRFYSEFGVSRAFSYDKPSVSGLTPNNAAPSGYSLLTINGINFGPFLDDPWRVERQDPATIDALVPVTLPVASGIQVCARARLCCCMSTRLSTPCTQTDRHTTHTHTHTHTSRTSETCRRIRWRDFLQAGTTRHFTCSSATRHVQPLLLAGWSSSASANRWINTTAKLVIVLALSATTQHAARSGHRSTAELRDTCVLGTRRALTLSAAARPDRQCARVSPAMTLASVCQLR